MISVLTPTIAARADLLERCKASVQLAVEHEHIIVLDDPPSGGATAPVARANALARYDWRIILPDDDYLVPNGVEIMLGYAVDGGLDFVLGLQGQAGQDGVIYEWANTYPESGATGAFLWHKRLNAVAELPAESCFPGRTDERGNDFLLLNRWVAAGAKYASLPVRVLVHTVDG
jgi:hypothetical protein